MDYISIISLVLGVVGSLLSVIVKFLYISKRDAQEIQKKRERVVFAEQIPPLPIGKIVLVSFSSVVLIFGIFTVIYYWKQIIQEVNTIIFATWLFLTMIAGMFVQVISSNYKNGRLLFDVTASQLTYPLLFSLVVYFPIWAIGASAPHNLFSFYAAFLNGFFWETVVASAKLPNKNND